MLCFLFDLQILNPSSIFSSLILKLKLIGEWLLILKLFNLFSSFQRLADYTNFNFNFKLKTHTRRPFNSPEGQFDIVFQF